MHDETEHVQHTHEHEHNGHTHTHEHEHNGHTHTHEHDHDGHTHTHEHEHDGHTHTHEHEHDGHTHTHEHGHDGHSHTHNAPAAGDKNELKALIKFTLEHNEHHLEDLHSMIHQLEDFGEMDAAKELDTAMDDYKKGNAKMQAALDMIKE